MRVERGASQILFGLLPAQTVDLEGGVWQVSRWADPVSIPIDQATVRDALIQAIAPWQASQNDGGVSAELYGQAQILVMAVNEDRGVVVEPFPKQWRCRQCNRVVTSSGQPCQCGAKRFAQMQFVAYHKCGRIQEPRLQRCPTHRQVAVRLPGTAAARELYFYCPICDRRLSSGFPFQTCECGASEGMTRNVHRAGTVFAPHYTVLVNPPDPAEAARLRATGGGARALDWVLDGLDGAGPGQGQQTIQGIEEALLRQGLSADFAREVAHRALERGEVGEGATNTPLDLPDNVRNRAQEEAISLSSALEKGRVRVQDMVEGSEPPLRTLYETSYRTLTERARLANVELLTDFPVTTLAFGFTREGRDPTTSTLVPFRERGAIQAYGLQAHTEALLLQLDPLQVASYLHKRGFRVPKMTDKRMARIELMRAMEIPRPTEEQVQPLGCEVVTLLHSYGHRLIRSLAATAGIERDGLSEYLLPHHLSVIIYAAARGEFVLGGLQSVFETGLETVLSKFVYGESRCPLDPGCRAGGGACMACIHLGEPSCRWFNRFLDRRVLFGENGFLTEAADA